MNHFKTWAVLAALPSVALAACGPTNMMGGDYESMQATLTSAEAENRYHADACEAAPSISVMMDEVARHDESMNDIVEYMDGALGHMGDGSTGMGMRHCSGLSFDHLSRSVGDIHAMISDHVSAMKSAVSLDSARSECSTHTGAMHGLMQNMKGDLESMSCVHK